MKNLKIGRITLTSPFVLAPMAGYTDCAMRKMAKESGAGLTVTEMVSAKGLLYNGEKSASLLSSCAEEDIKCAQLFGGNPDDFYAVLTSTPYLDEFDIIDINMGCPVPKIVKNGEGSALMLDRKRAQEIVKACVKGAKGRPVTVKTRVGFYDGDILAPDFCLAMQDAGASAISLHGRTKQAGYGGLADWSVIEKVKSLLSVPLIGSGDCDESNSHARLEVCDGIMIGRKAVGNTRIFAELLGKEVTESKSAELLRHIDYMVKFYGERYALVNIRKFIGGYYAGVTGNREIKAKAFSALSTDELKEIIIKTN